jgi:hypothetical protein
VSGRERKMSIDTETGKSPRHARQGTVAQSRLEQIAEIISRETGLINGNVVSAARAILATAEACLLPYGPYGAASCIPIPPEATAREGSKLSDLIDEMNGERIKLKNRDQTPFEAKLLLFVEAFIAALEEAKREIAALGIEGWPTRVAIEHSRRVALLEAADLIETANDETSRICLIAELRRRALADSIEAQAPAAHGTEPSKPEAVMPDKSFMPGIDEPIIE